jgi:hypothetical protein
MLLLQLFFAPSPTSIGGGVLELDDLKLRNKPQSTYVENLIDLPILNEPEILHNLRKRYFEDLIYTYTGTFDNYTHIHTHCDSSFRD